MEGGREAAGEGEDGGWSGVGPSSLAIAKQSTGRDGGAAGAGGQRCLPGAVASSHEQQHRRVIRWERFLPRRSLRVLLVEQDDSNRHIVTALLRKCSYHGGQEELTYLFLGLLMCKVGNWIEYFQDPASFIRIEPLFKGMYPHWWKETQREIFSLFHGQKTHQLLGSRFGDAFQDPASFIRIEPLFKGIYPHWWKETQREIFSLFHGQKIHQLLGSRFGDAFQDPASFIRIEPLFKIDPAVHVHMARKSKARAPARKRQEKLATAFRCPFCSHPEDVECRIDLKLRLGQAVCRVCGEGFATRAHRLTEPIDVYTDWIDECKKANVCRHLT